jgi:dipeptidase E
MKTKIYLIGGGEIRKGETKLIDEDIMSQFPKGSNFVFIGFAAMDSPGYADTISSVYGIKCNVIVPTVAKGREFAIESIKSADVIYLGGGDTQELMRVFVEWDLIEYVQIAAEQGKCIVGMSAGALILSEWYIHEDENVFELRKGLGMIPMGIMVHANETTYNKAKLLWLNSKASDTYPFVAVGECAASFVDGSKTTKIGSGNIWTIAKRFNSKD